MFYAILYGLPKNIKMYIYCIHLFMSLFKISLQSIIGKILPNLSQKRLEKPLLLLTTLNLSTYCTHRGSEWDKRGDMGVQSSVLFLHTCATQTFYSHGYEVTAIKAAD